MMHFTADDVLTHMRVRGLSMLTERELFEITEMLDITLLIRERTVRKSVWRMLKSSGWTRGTMKAGGIQAWLFMPPKEELSDK